MRLRQVIDFISLLIVGMSFVVSAENVIYAGEERGDYTTTLLKHALSYSPEKGYQAKAFGAIIPKLRALELLENNDGIDVIVGSASVERVNRYQAIHFPILKGLNGWRVGLVHRSTPNLLSKVHSIDGLKAYTIGQFHTWTDTTILEQNGLPIVKAGDVGGLFKMVAKQRLDYFPRSILEVEQDYQHYQHLPIAIEQSLLIHYPAGFYYYVSKENIELAKVIKHGLERALADGSFERIFNEFYGDIIAKLRSQQRQVIRLNNPVLPEGVPVERPELWIDFEQFTEVAVD